MHSQQVNPCLFPIDLSIVKAIGMENSQFPIEMTSFDGKPFPIPSHLSLLLIPGSCPSKEEKLLNIHNVPLKARNEINEKAENFKKEILKKRETKHQDKAEKSFDAKRFECIQKKVKLEENLSNSSTKVEEATLSVQASIITQNAPTEKSKKECKSIAMVSFDQERKELIYTLRIQSIDKKISEINLTRDEVLTEDPKLLLYFYENHIEFTKSPGFTPKILKNL